MTDQELENKLASARRAGPIWNAGRQQQVKWSLMARLERPRRRFLFPALALGCIAGATIGVLGWRNLLPSSREGAAGGPSDALVASPSGDRPLPKLADGSSIVLDGPSAILKKTVETNDEVAFQLEAGGAHFEVARRPSRVFRVHAGPVTVQVIGTRFHVRRQDARAQVVVDRGKVLVSWWGGSRELSAGQEGTFPPERPGQNQVGPDGSPRPAAATPRRATTSWATAPHADTSVRHGAIATPATPSVDRDPSGSAPQALFIQADRARTHGHPAAAVRHLRAILEHYPNDPHAPVAAFTIGRLLLDSLKQPRQAALAFAQARALANGGPLAEDALAREVEALNAAGDGDTARQRAELYARLFPNGPRLHTVMRFGGLRSPP